MIIMIVDCWFIIYFKICVYRYWIDLVMYIYVVNIIICLIFDFVVFDFDRVGVGGDYGWIDGFFSGFGNV